MEGERLAVAEALSANRSTADDSRPSASSCWLLVRGRPNGRGKRSVGDKLNSQLHGKNKPRRKRWLWRNEGYLCASATSLSVCPVSWLSRCLRRLRHFERSEPQHRGLSQQQRLTVSRPNPTWRLLSRSRRTSHHRPIRHETHCGRLWPCRAWVPSCTMTDRSTPRGSMRMADELSPPARILTRAYGIRPQAGSLPTS